jgi:hypothetical protein
MPIQNHQFPNRPFSRQSRAVKKLIHRHTTAVLAALLFSRLAGFAQVPPAPERIGVYDSRAIAVAYAGSAGQVKKKKALTAQLKQARDTGDTNRVLWLEAEGRAWQSTLNRQGFGTAPVDDLLAEIAGDLPAIRDAAGVTRIISKWDKAELARHPRAEWIDVTMELVDAFQPSATQRRRAQEIQMTRPQKTIN